MKKTAKQTSSKKSSSCKSDINEKVIIEHDVKIKPLHDFLIIKLKEKNVSKCGIILPGAKDEYEKWVTVIEVSDLIKNISVGDEVFIPFDDNFGFIIDPEDKLTRMINYNSVLAVKR